MQGHVPGTLSRAQPWVVVTQRRGQYRPERGQGVPAIVTVSIPGGSIPVKCYQGAGGETEAAGMGLAGLTGTVPAPR